MFTADDIRIFRAYAAAKWLLALVEKVTPNRKAQERILQDGASYIRDHSESFKYIESFFPFYELLLDTPPRLPIDLAHLTHRALRAIACGCVPWPDIPTRAVKRSLTEAGTLDELQPTYAALLAALKETVKRRKSYRNLDERQRDIETAVRPHCTEQQMHALRPRIAAWRDESNEFIALVTTATLFHKSPATVARHMRRTPRSPFLKFFRLRPLAGVGAIVTALGLLSDTEEARALLDLLEHDDANRTVQRRASSRKK